MSTLLIGADPELFAFRGTNPVSVHDVLTGSKDKPKTVPYGAVQVDGTAAEFNIDPCSTKAEFLFRIDKVKSTIESIIKKSDPSLVLRAVPAVTFNKDEWSRIPDFNKELGCNPDFNAYTGEANDSPDPSSRPTMRTGSGHIHIGWSHLVEKVHPDVHFQDCRQIVALLDNVILPFEKLWDTDTDRRSLYGKPGAFRPKSYGCEYRVLSNAWVDKPKVASWLYDVVHACVKHLMKEKEAKSILDYKEEWNRPTVCHRRILNYNYILEVLKDEKEAMLLFRQNLGTVLDLETPDGPEDFV